MAKTTERAFLATPTRPGPASVISSPFQFSTSSADRLRVRLWNSVAGVVVALTGQTQDLAGARQVFSQSYTPAATRALVEQFFALTDGYVLSLALEVLSGTLRRGQCFAQVDLVRGNSSAVTVLGTILQGYIGQFTALAFPGSPLENCLDGPGYVHVLASSDPPPGGIATLLVPTNTRYRALAASGTFATSGAPGNRTAYVYAIAAGGIVTLWQAPQGLVHPASTAIGYHWFAGAGSFATPAAAPQVAPLPWPNALQEADRLSVLAINQDIADDWSAINWTVEEWINVWA